MTDKGSYCSDNKMILRNAPLCAHSLIPIEMVKFFKIDAIINGREFVSIYTVVYEYIFDFVGNTNYLLGVGYYISKHSWLFFAC